MTTNFECDIEPTKVSSKEIHAIHRDTVHKICSGQVVLNLAVAVKELVENSIDAGATLVEVKLKEQGLEQIEVSDNGSGVEESNFEGLTAKYHTSKLREFIDLESVETFGFRGEALSSLCAVSDMIITTKHTKSQYGTKLVLDHFGKFNSKSPCPREVGTTVTITNLFSTLPVRKKEFQKNIKREFTRMCNVLQGYCLVLKNVRIICTNQNAKGAKTTIISKHATENILDNINAIFGGKQTNDLLKIEKQFGRGNESKKFTLDDFDDPESSFVLTQEEVDRLNLARFTLEGWISTCTHGSGRSSRDRQFFYVNDRPCEPKQVIKLVNDIYHRYNSHQYPFVFLNVKIDRSDVDVNLTPDKRQVLVNNEKILLLAIKKSLLNTFDEIPSTYKLQNIGKIFAIDKPKKSTVTTKSEDEEENIFLTQPNPNKFAEMLSQWKMTGNTSNPNIHIKKNHGKRKAIDDEIEIRKTKMKKIQEYLSQDEQIIKKEIRLSYKSESEDDETKLDIINETTVPNFTTKEEEIEGCKLTILTPEKMNTNTVIKEGCLSNLFTQFNDNENESETIVTCKNLSQSVNGHKLVVENIPSNSNEDSDCEYDSTSYLPDSRKTIHLKSSLNEIKRTLKLEEDLYKKVETNKNIDRLKFKSEINPTKNKNAEEELETEIKKEMFSDMEIVGQFNLGFIITKLENDLFIVDQHATDEKYNFEILQKTTKLQNQKLVVPQNLELTAVNELILIDNLDIFKMNGFEFKIDEDAEPTKKVKLIGKPISHNWEFGKDDIDELIFMLQDSPNTVCRPTRVRAMFASRACHKSVTIGKALDKSTMRKLIDHMGEIEQPWNCPHGRPTMRHLINLALLEEHDE